MLYVKTLEHELQPVGAGAGDDAGYLQQIKQGRNSVLSQSDTLLLTTALPAGGTVS